MTVSNARSISTRTNLDRKAANDAVPQLMPQVVQPHAHAMALGAISGRVSALARAARVSNPRTTSLILTAARIVKPLCVTPALVTSFRLSMATVSHLKKMKTATASGTAAKVAASFLELVCASVIRSICRRRLAILPARKLVLRPMSTKKVCLS